MAWFGRDSGERKPDRPSARLDQLTRVDQVFGSAVRAGDVGGRAGLLYRGAPQGRRRRGQPRGCLAGPRVQSTGHRRGLPVGVDRDAADNSHRACRPGGCRSGGIELAAAGVGHSLSRVSVDRCGRTLHHDCYRPCPAGLHRPGRDQRPHLLLCGIRDRWGRGRPAVDRGQRHASGASPGRRLPGRGVGRRPDCLLAVKRSPGAKPGL